MCSVLYCTNMKIINQAGYSTPGLSCQHKCRCPVENPSSSVFCCSTWGCTVVGLHARTLFPALMQTAGLSPRAAELIEPCGYEAAAAAALCFSGRTIIEPHNLPCWDLVQSSRKILLGALIRSIQRVSALLIVTWGLLVPTSEWDQCLTWHFLCSILQESGGYTKGGSD